MIVSNIKNIDEIKVDLPGAQNAFMRVLVGPKEGWEDYVMRIFELEENGYSPRHTHDWPHINYIIEGEGTLQIGEELYPIAAGGYAYVPAMMLHQFKNTGKDRLKFICIIPKEEISIKMNHSGGRP